ncbi:unnamed protein product, partial [Laminaria digitata]
MGKGPGRGLPPAGEVGAGGRGSGYAGRERERESDRMAQGAVGNNLPPQERSASSRDRGPRPMNQPPAPGMDRTERGPGGGPPGMGRGPP